MGVSHRFDYNMSSHIAQLPALCSSSPSAVDISPHIETRPPFPRRNLSSSCSLMGSDSSSMDEMRNTIQGLALHVVHSKYVHLMKADTFSFLSQAYSNN